jgi:hypothetical protein
MGCYTVEARGRENMTDGLVAQSLVQYSTVLNRIYVKTDDRAR